MKKSLLLFLGLLLYSTTPSAATLVMECEWDNIFGERNPTKVWKLETVEDSTSKNLLTYQNHDGKWIGVCNSEDIGCSKQLYSVVIENLSTFTMTTNTYDFILLSHTRRFTDVYSINPVKTRVYEEVWECKRIGS